MYDERIGRASWKNLGKLREKKPIEKCVGGSMWCGHWRSVNRQLWRSQKMNVKLSVTAWVNLEDIILSGISQSQKDKSRVIPLNRRNLK